MGKGKYRAWHTLIAFSVLYSRPVPDATVSVLSQVISELMLTGLPTLERRPTKIPVELVYRQQDNVNVKMMTVILTFSDPKHQEEAFFSYSLFLFSSVSHFILHSSLFPLIFSLVHLLFLVLLLASLSDPKHHEESSFPIFYFYFPLYPTLLFILLTFLFPLLFSLLHLLFLILPLPSPILLLLSFSSLFLSTVLNFTAVHSDLVVLWTNVLLYLT